MFWQDQLIKDKGLRSKSGFPYICSQIIGGMAYRVINSGFWSQKAEIASKSWINWFDICPAFPTSLPRFSDGRLSFLCKLLKELPVFGQ